MLGYFRLDEEYRGPQIDAYGQPIDHHFNDVILEQSRVTIVGRQGMPIRNKEETLILILNLDPVLQHSVVIP